MSQAEQLELQMEMITVQKPANCLQNKMHAVSHISFMKANILMGINCLSWTRNAKKKKKRKSLIIQNEEKKNFMASFQDERPRVEGGQSEARYSRTEMSHSAIIQQSGQLGDAVEDKTST